jgi:hypothetical protein
MEKGMLIIDTGAIRGPLDGKGVRFLLEKRDGEWVIVGFSPWIS